MLLYRMCKILFADINIREHDLKDRVFVKDAQIKQLQDDFKEQIHAKDEQIRAKDEQIKQMQEHQKETYKT